MTNASDFEGLLSLMLVFVCSCVHIRRVPRLRAVVVKPATPAPLLGVAVLRTAKVVLRHRRVVAFLCAAVSFLVLARRY
jgi:hypothetical protein